MLEAGNRIGGRINTVPFASNVLDLGAQWVHGERFNVVWEMVRQHNVLDVTPEDYFVGWPLSSEGNFHNDYSRLFEVSEWIYREKPGCENLWATSYGSYFMDS